MQSTVTNPFTVHSVRARGDYKPRSDDVFFDIAVDFLTQRQTYTEQQALD